MLQKNISLKNHSNYKIGGPASYFFEFKTVEELKDGLSEFYSLFPDVSKRPPIFILGGGTNILFDDRGFDGLVIKNSLHFLKRDGDSVIVGGGTAMTDLLNFCIENSLSGLEWAGGLPGSVGGAIRGNAGAYKGETKDCLGSVKTFDLKTFNISEKSKEDCEFGYRMSFFKKQEGKDQVIIEATFRLKPGNQEEIKSLTEDKIRKRRERHPLEYPNIGSTFKNVPYEDLSDDLKNELKEYIKEDPFPVIPVAKLLSLCGVMGKREGGAMISEKHPNFIVNLGNASTGDVRKLISYAKERIKEKYQISLEEEIFYL